MTALPPHHRPGLTLTEVLVAMFVMALGLISLLTLFPLGAIQIGYALRDDRCAQTAAEADTYMRSWWQARVVEQIAKLPASAADLPDDAIWAFDDPNQEKHTPARVAGVANHPELSVNSYLASGRFIIPTGSATPNDAIPPSGGATSTATTKVVPTATTLTGEAYFKGSDSTQNIPANPGTPPNSYYVDVGRGQRVSTPSYPVFIDPLNVQTNTGTGDASWVGYKSATTSSGWASNKYLLMPRRGLSTATTTQQVLQTCCLLDDITFDTNGTPFGSPFTRDGRYNWSAVIHRTANDRMLVANLTILVFDGRPPLLKVPDAEVVVSLANSNARTSASWANGSTSVKLTVPAPSDPDAPSVVRRGGWLMDGSVSATGFRNAQFYRIVGLTETGNANEYQLDLEPPVRNATSANTEPTTLYFFAGLAEVFVRPPLVPNPIPGQ